MKGLGADPQGSHSHDSGPPDVATLSWAVTGHLSLALFFSPVVWLLWWLISQATPGPLSGSLSLLLTAISVVVSSVVVAVCERPAVLSAGHSDPGGWGYAIWEFIIPPIIGGIVGFFISPGVALCGSLSMLIVFATLACFMKTWKPGMSKHEVQQAWKDTKTLTRDMATESRIEKGWVNPPRKWDGN